MPPPSPSRKRTRPRRRISNAADSQKDAGKDKDPKDKDAKDNSTKTPDGKAADEHPDSTGSGVVIDEKGDILTNCMWSLPPIAGW